MTGQSASLPKITFVHPPRPAKTLDQHYSEILTRFDEAGAKKAWESRDRGGGAKKPDARSMSIEALRDHLQNDHGKQNLDAGATKPEMLKAHAFQHAGAGARVAGMGAVSHEHMDIGMGPAVGRVQSGMGPNVDKRFRR